MRDSDRRKPGSKPGASPPDKPARGTTQTDKPSASPAQPGHKAGRIVHDERGNAVWDWVVETGRIFIGSTSRLLRKLEAPELKIEETGESELRLESDRDSGGGYDPYGGSSPTRTRSTSGSRGPGASSTKPCEGGGYDPYSTSGTRKPGRKV